MDIQEVSAQPDTEFSCVELMGHGSHVVVSFRVFQ